MKRPFSSPCCSSVIEASYRSGNCDVAGVRADSCLNPIPAHAKARKRTKRDPMVSRIAKLPGVFTAGRGRPWSRRWRIKGIRAPCLSAPGIWRFVRVGPDVDSRNNNNFKFPRITAEEGKNGLVSGCALTNATQRSPLHVWRRRSDDAGRRLGAVSVLVGRMAQVTILAVGLSVTQYCRKVPGAFE